MLDRSQPAFLRSNCRMRQYPTSLLPCLRASCLRAQKFGLHAQHNSGARAMGTLDAAAAAVGSQAVSPSTTFSPGYGRYSAAFQHSTFPFPPKLRLPHAPHPIHLPTQNLPSPQPSHPLTVESCPVEGAPPPSSHCTARALPGTHATALKQLVASLPSTFRERVLSIAAGCCFPVPSANSRGPAAESTRRTASTAPSLALALEVRQQNKVHLGDREDHDSTTSKGLGIIGQPHRDLRPQGAATQSTGTGCIVHPTQVHAFAVGASCPRALSRSLCTVPWTRGRWSRPTDRPSWGGPGLELYYGLGGGIFIAEVTSINPFTTHSARQSGAAAALYSALPLPSPSLPFSRHPPARPSFRLCLATFFLLHPGDRAFTCCTAPFPRPPLISPSLSPHNQNKFKSWTGHLSICWVATLSYQSGLDPRPSILEAL